MSYDVYLKDPTTGHVLPSPERFEEGGTRAFGGTDECHLNVTYNYCDVFGDLVRDLDGLAARDTLWALEEFCWRWRKARLSDDDDYWKPTPANARRAVERLRSFARTHPDGVWRVT